MNMEKYIPQFQQEHISGDLLLDLNDDILKEELGIVKEVHSIKLKKVMSGEQSIEKYIGGLTTELDDSYMKMIKP